jgi:hypothetical protein
MVVIAVILRYDQLEMHLECVRINPPGGPP